jgi:hypothetical protein
MRIRVFLIFFTLILATLVSVSYWKPVPVHATDDLGMTLSVLESDTTGIIFEVSISNYSIDLKTLSLGTFHKITIPNTTPSNDPGKPQLPVVSSVIGLPPNSTPSLEILYDDAISLPGFFSIMPAPYPTNLPGSLEPGKWMYDWDQEVYASEKYYPDAPAIIAEDAWLRDQHIARVEIYPFQFNPVKGSIILHRSLKIQVDFPNTSITPLEYSNNRTSPASDPFGSALETVLLNYDDAKNWRGFPNHEKISSIASFLGPRYKIIVDHDGIYKITHSDLSDAGMKVGEIDPRTFRVTNQGDDVAIHVAGEEDGQFDPQDYILFYGQQFSGERMAERYKNENAHWYTYHQYLTDGNRIDWKPELNSLMLKKYTKDNVYWLTVGSTPGLRMNRVNGDPTGNSSDPVPHYRTIVHEEESIRWWTEHFTSEETWFWEYLSDITGTYTTSLSSVAPSVTQPLSATVRAEVVAYTHNSNASPDHHTRFELNGVLLDDSYWDGISCFSLNSSISQSNLIEGENKLVFTPFDDGATLVPQFFFDWFEIEYHRLFNAVQDQINFTGNEGGTWKYEVGGFSDTSGLQILEITDSLNPKMITNPAINGNTVSISLTHEENAAFFMASDNGIQSPQLIEYYQPPDLSSPSNAYDYLFITHSDFITSTHELANYRSAQGLSTLVIDIDDLYNEFNDGIYHPIAIKNFLAYTFSGWDEAPIYALLIGDGHWNMMQYAQWKFGSEPIYMPPYLAWVDPWMGEVDSTNLLANVVGDDALADLHIARLPVNSPSELEDFIDKLIAYESISRGEWQQHFLFIADNADGVGDYPLLANDIISDYLNPSSYFQADRIFQDDYNCPPQVNCAQVTKAITNTLNITGSLVVNYIGHAAIKRWSHENIFTLDHMTTLENRNQLPVILSLDCLDGYWFGPAHPTVYPGLIEELIRAKDSGAIGAFSPTGLGVAKGHDVLHKGFYDSLFINGNWGLGAGTMNAKVALFEYGYSQDLLHTFTTFGDPAMQIHNPYELNLKPGFISASDVPGKSISYTFTITNTGAISDSFEILLKDNNWPTTPSSVMIGPLEPGQSQGFYVTIDIPLNASSGEFDQVTLTAMSKGDQAKSAFSKLTTTANRGVTIVPPASTSSGVPGSSVTYDLMVTNISETADSFDIYLQNTPEWKTTPQYQNIGPLTPDQSFMMNVVVNIPMDASSGECDTAIIIVQSNSDSDKKAVAILTTSSLIEDYMVYIPYLNK